MPVLLDVYLNDRRVGAMTNLPGDYNLFTFDDEYMADHDRPILSQAFLDQGGEPERIIARTHGVAPAFFANLLPEEGSMLRQIVARQYGMNRTRDFPYLRALGGDLPGAVVMRDSGGPDTDVHEAAPALMPHEQRLRFSLAGMQLKFSASALHERLSIGAVDGAGFWIVKLPTNAYARLPENEFAVMTLARAIGLTVPEIRLVNLDEIVGIPEALPMLRNDEPRLAYAIKRFDRTETSRIHCEDFNQVTGRKPEDKYENHSSSSIAQQIADLCPPQDAEDFVRRLVFGVCIGNNDMHLKNWALIYPDSRNARLAPMYDFVSTRYYFPSADLTLTIGGEKSFARIDRDALRRFAKIAELSERRTLVLASETVELLHEAWKAISPEFADRDFVASTERHFTLVPLMAGH